jgi:ATP-binding cassette, subfamily B, bacterial
MSENTPTPLASEVRAILHRAVQAGRLVPAKEKRALGGAALLMAITGASNTVIAIVFGKMVDDVAAGASGGSQAHHLYAMAALCLGLIAGTYVLRESLNVWRRYLVDGACARLTSAMNLRLVAHMMRVNLDKLSSEKVGTLHARTTRSVDGLIRFVRLSFLDFLPALFTGTIALATAISKSPLLGLTMIGVVPMSIFLTVRQIISQKGVRLALMRDCEDIEGALIEQMSGIEYVRAAHTLDGEVARLTDCFDRRRAREVGHHFKMSLYSCANFFRSVFECHGAPGRNPSRHRRGARVEPSRRRSLGDAE